MVGRWASFWGPVSWQVRTVSFGEGKPYWILPLWEPTKIPTPKDVFESIIFRTSRERWDMFSDRFVEGISRILEVVATITKCFVSFRMIVKSVYRKVVKLTNPTYIKMGWKKQRLRGYRQLIPVCWKTHRWLQDGSLVDRSRLKITPQELGMKKEQLASEIRPLIGLFLTPFL